MEKLAENLLCEQGVMRLPVPVFDLVRRFEAFNESAFFSILKEKVSVLPKIELDEMEPAAPIYRAH